jgi:putative SOS response-associated peptidase YedK
MITETFRVPEVPELPLRYNVAPTQPVGVVRQRDHERSFRLVRWGLVPFWADDPKIGSRLINARADTIATKPAFRAAFKERRCLVVADGFYEWQTVDGKKQPFLIHRADDHPFGFAGLWERWRSPEGAPLETCTIVTTDANDLMRPIHDRMPVILKPGDFERWLDPEADPGEALQALLRPYADGDLVATPVGTRVNNARNDGPECAAALEEGKPEPGMLF